jgi:hypothetical protein
MSSEFQHGAIFSNKSARGLPSHPWVIISDPEQDEDNVLIVNLTDADAHFDDSCILTPDDDRQNVKKRSCIAYHFAKVTSIALLNRVDGQGGIFNKGQLSEGVMQKILNGAYESDELHGKHRDLLRRQRLID